MNATVETERPGEALLAGFDVLADFLDVEANRFDFFLLHFYI